MKNNTILFNDILTSILEYLHPNNYVDIGVGNGERLSLVDSGTLCIGIGANQSIVYPINNDCKLFPVSAEDFFNKFDMTVCQVKCDSSCKNN